MENCGQAPREKNCWENPVEIEAKNCWKNLVKFVEKNCWDKLVEFDVENYRENPEKLAGKNPVEIVVENYWNPLEKPVKPGDVESEVWKKIWQELGQSSALPIYYKLGEAFGLGWSNGRAQLSDCCPWNCCCCCCR